MLARCAFHGFSIGFQRCKSDSQGAKVCKYCRSRQELFFSNEIAIQTSICLQSSASIQPRTSLLQKLAKFHENSSKREENKAEGIKGEKDGKRGKKRRTTRNKKIFLSETCILAQKTHFRSENSMFTAPWYLRKKSQLF